jgi:hypothetical protein
MSSLSIGDDSSDDNNPTSGLTSKQTKKPYLHWDEGIGAIIDFMNKLTAVIQLGTSIAMFVLVPVMISYAKVPWYSFFPADRPDGITTFEWVPVPRKWVDVHLGYFAAVFLLLSAFYHIAVASPIGKVFYFNYLYKERNPIRWFEYSISASIMHVHIAMLSGIFDVHLLFTIFGLSVVTQIMGNMAERDKNMSNFRMGFFPFFFKWIPMFCYFFRSVKHSDDVPDFVWAIIMIIFFLDLTFALNLYLFLSQRGWWKEYAVTELTFIVLSLTSKQLLAWIAYSGTASLKKY